MDEVCVRRWLAGDPNAAAEVSVWVRERSDRVLRHTALLERATQASRQLLQNPANRADMVALVVRKVLGRPVETVARLELLTLALAARQAVDVLREASTLSGPSHLDAEESVKAAVGGHVLAHMDQCPKCAEEVRLLQTITGRLPKPKVEPLSSEPAQPASQQAPGPEVSEAQFPPLPAPLPAPLPKRPQGDRRPPKLVREMGDSKDFQATFSSSRGLGIWAIWPFLVIALGIWFYQNWVPSEGGPGAMADVADLADRSVPEVARLGLLPPGAQVALGDLSRGDCRTAAGRFRGVRRGHPDVARLYLLEASSFVCAGDGARALDVLDEMVGLGLTPPRSAHWVRAQSLLLEGRAEEALMVLSEVRIADSRRRADAAKQVLQVQARLGTPAP